MNKNIDHTEIHNKILEGIKRAVDKLIIKTAQQDGELAFSENGKVILVKAKDLLNK